MNKKHKLELIHSNILFNSTLGITFVLDTRQNVIGKFAVKVQLKVREDSSFDTKPYPKEKYHYEWNVSRYMGKGYLRLKSCPETVFSFSGIVISRVRTTHGGDLVYTCLQVAYYDIKWDAETSVVFYLSTFY